MRIREIRNTELFKKLSGFLKRPACQTFMAKGIVLSILWVICLIPVWLFILVWVLASPEGFWQVTIIVALFVFLGGGLQIFLAIIGIWFTLEILSMD